MLKNTTLALALASLTLWGCGSSDKDTDGTDTDPAGTATGGTGGGTGGGGATDSGGGGGGGGGGRALEPDGFGILLAEFGYDADSGEMRSFSFDGTEYDARIVAYAYNSSTGDGCIVEASFGSPVAVSESGWVGSNALFVGFVAPEDATIDSSDCDAQLEDANWIAFMQGGFLQSAAGSTLGFGVGDLSADAADIAAGRTYWASEEPFAMGGGWYWELLEGATFANAGYMSDGVAFGFEVDGDFGILVDGDGVAVRLDPAGAVDPGTGLVSGYYTIEPFSSIVGLAFE